MIYGKRTDSRRVKKNYVIETCEVDEDGLPPPRPTGDTYYRQVLAASKEDAENQCNELHFEKVVAGPFDTQNPKDVEELEKWE